ncbi:MAG: aminotransferase class I/II-fold pyridoxal phosphate-dependent enzyme [Candidatus Cloacimonetes bacterium]|jgi:aspartate/methionine/tyrosine aminotransferase|nr:aminotransferase class I/II-fold pyridoxal phosphate-dependent enzyme [Candidatus Cloacimonadota bacterium]
MMSEFQPFELERWQSTWENSVEFNLSESGVHPLTIGELRALAGDVDIDDVMLGYGHTNGTEELRSRIASLYPGASAESVAVANGSAEANFAATWRFAQDGGTIAVVVPTYMQTPGVARAFGARVVQIPLRPELGWQPDGDEVRRLTRDGLQAIVVTNPCNPTGSVLTDESRRALIEAAATHDAWIIADEVYAGAELDGRQTASFFGSYPRVVATGSLSKAYGLPGLRIGWAVSTPDMIGELWARRDYTTIAPATPSDRLATLALEPGVRARLLERTRRHIRDGITVLEAWLEEQQLFTWQRPAAGAICLATFTAPVDTSQLAERLRVEQSVLVVPGEQFGVPNAIRLGFGAPAATLRTALGRIAVTLNDIRGRIGADLVITG